MPAEYTPNQIAELLSYNPTTGALRWKPRPRSMFVSLRGHMSWNAKNAHYEAGSANGKGYICLRINGTSLKAHRIAFAIMTGHWPTSEVDHINGKTSDNRWENLRESTRKENTKNVGLAKNNTSGHSGVHQTKTGRWVAKVQRTHLGTFTNKADAVKARQAALDNLGYSTRHGT